MTRSRMIAVLGTVTVAWVLAAIVPIASAGATETVPAPATLSDPTPGAAWAWGDNYFGQLGNGTNTDTNAPVQVSGLTDAVAVAGGAIHSLALRSDGTVVAWGSNEYGQLGDGNWEQSSNVPVQVSGLTDAVAVAGGGSHSLALRSDGTVWAWGDNLSGQLGDGTNDDSHVPVQVFGITDAVAIAGGNSHSLAVRSDGTVWAWGGNWNGQLGDGTNNDSNVPVQVSGITDAVAVAGGAYHSLAVRSDGTVRAWGSNSNGQLGNGTWGGSSNVPVKVSKLSDAVAVAGGGYHSLALRSDGTVWAWGDSSSVPVKVPSLTGVVAIAAGGGRGLALRANGKVFYAGGPAPLRVSGLTGAVAIAAGDQHSLVVGGSYTPRAEKSPAPRDDPGMVYDAARSLVVLFGGQNYINGDTNDLDDTWTWNGKAWTQQHAATSPSARHGMGMAYDAARGEVVLFGGRTGYTYLNDTWTWDGTTWTQEHPPTSPPARGTAMTYDAARGVVLLFGGPGDTWTWDGTTWTQQHPPTSPSGDGMVYNPVRSEVVLFGGNDFGGCSGDTWTWDGTTWTQVSRPSATSPYVSYGAGMAYDAVRGEVVLVGGSGCDVRGDTWTWGGTTWTQEHPATTPSARYLVGMAYDAVRGEVILFGGSDGSRALGDTWVWNGATWSIAVEAHMRLSPSSGAPGTAMEVTATGFAAFERVTITFVDSDVGETPLGACTTDAKGVLKAKVRIPFGATFGPQKVTAAGAVSHETLERTFTVT